MPHGDVRDIREHTWVCLYQALPRLDESALPLIIGYYAISKIVQVDTFFLIRHKSKIGLNHTLLTRFFAEVLRIMISPCPQSFKKFLLGRNLLWIFKVGPFRKSVRIEKRHPGLEFGAVFFFIFLCADIHNKMCKIYSPIFWLHFMQAFGFFWTFIENGKNQKNGKLENGDFLGIPINYQSCVGCKICWIPKSHIVTRGITSHREASIVTLSHVRHH